MPHGAVFGVEDICWTIRHVAFVLLCYFTLLLLKTHSQRNSHSHTLWVSVLGSPVTNYITIHLHTVPLKPVACYCLLQSVWCFLSANLPAVCLLHSPSSQQPNIMLSNTKSTYLLLPSITSRTVGSLQQYRLRLRLRNTTTTATTTTTLRRRFRSTGL